MNGVVEGYKAIRMGQPEPAGRRGPAAKLAR